MPRTFTRPGGEGSPAPSVQLMHATAREDFTITLDVCSPEEHRARAALASTAVIAAVYGTDTMPAGPGEVQLSASIIEIHPSGALFSSFISTSPTQFCFALVG